MGHQARTEEIIEKEAVQTNQGVGAVNSAISGLTAQEFGGPEGVHKTVLGLSDVVMPTTDAGANGGHGSLKLYDMPEGHIKFLGAHMTLNEESTGASDGISDTATIETGLGSASVGTDNAALTSTEDDILTGVSGDLAAGERDLGSADGADLTLDGSTTPVDVNLNAAVAADDHGANAGELTYNGTITLYWLNLGDD